ncbi:hypothetical protein BTO15_15555 [Polaribacter sejongensis]|uniref:Uncharacterized protein n=1 Tax=Polaribacter sejongensis TaxID=985043 RepID=A0ABM6Q2E9_9FLAO|nr:hypothetical protein [Polaribacter sejongensis]AUC23429.1 hypothetical protein BTO15_15555 [Polaribacter sejongensis]
MWIRYHIKCHNCKKVTNLRLHLLSREKQDVKFNCPNSDCRTVLEAQLDIDYEKFQSYTMDIPDASFQGFHRNFLESLDFKILRGEKTEGDFESGDFFLEYSDKLPVKKASTEPHNKFMATVRDPKNVIESGQRDNIRTLYDNNKWNELKDLVTAYQISNKKNIETISNRLKKECVLLQEKEFEFQTDLGFVNAYFFILNHFVFPWIDYEKHSDFIQYLFDTLFKESAFKNPQLNDVADYYTNDSFLQNFNHECSSLINEFIDLRFDFVYTFQDVDFKEKNISTINFTKLKSFYTDCFEFLGRYSIIPIKFMNYVERGDITAMPAGTPRNVNNPDDFENLSNGSKMEIFNKYSTGEIFEIFENRFDSKLRNGINHFKAKLDSESQIISYYPITKRPNEEYQISYSEFLLKSLNIFESVLRLNQFIKMFYYYNRDRKSAHNTV